MYKAFFKQLDRLTVAIAALLLGITVIAIITINYFFVDRLMLQDAQTLSRTAASQIRDELFLHSDDDKQINLADALSESEPVGAHMRQSFTLRSISKRSIAPAGIGPDFSARSLTSAPELWRFIQDRLQAQSYLNQLTSYAIYLPNGVVYLPSGLFDNHVTRQKYSSSSTIIGSVQSVFLNGSSLYAYREGSQGTYTQHFLPLTKNNRVVGVVMLDALQTGAGAKVASAVSNAVFLTTIAGLPIILLVVFLAWTRLKDSMRAQKEISFLELNDPLTELPNRAGFNQLLQGTIDNAQRNDEQFAIFSLDLDGFHKINDAIGHGIGDEILKSVAHRLPHYKPPNAVIARLSGDEFAMIFPDVTSAEEASQLAKVFLEEVAQPHPGYGEDIVCTGSIGIAFGPEDGVSGESLIKQAKLALYRAKDEGGNTFRFFEPDMDKALQKQRELERYLSQALRREEFELHYQPQVELTDRSVIGYEALLRWRHPEHGMISPADFIPVLEETKMIIEVGEYVLNRACQEALDFPDDVKVAVNLSPVQFEHQDIPMMVKRALAASGLPASRLELEITESVLMTDTKAAIKMLDSLKDLGVHVAMDDFGTGYSSLSYISEFEFDKIKIDRSFVSSIQTDERARAIITSVIGLGRALDIMITAEGIETSDQLLLIQAAGCHFGQGYLFGRPMPLAEILDDEETAESQVA